MQHDLNLKQMWASKQAKMPDSASLLKKGNAFKKAQLLKLIGSNAMLISVGIFIGLIWYYAQPEMITTKIGIVIVIAAMAIFLTVYNGMLPMLLKVNDGLNSSDYLAQLLKIQARQQLMHTTMLNLYFVMLSTGMALYLYEYASRMGVIGAALTYGITFGWVALNWFYIRPRTIRKQRAKTDALIAKFEDLKQQLESSDSSET